jgi:hypothetical protein
MGTRLDKGLLYVQTEIDGLRLDLLFPPCTKRATFRRLESRQIFGDYRGAVGG